MGLVHLELVVERQSEALIVVGDDWVSLATIPCFVSIFAHIVKVVVPEFIHCTEVVSNFPHERALTLNSVFRA